MKKSQLVSYAIAVVMLMQAAVTGCGSRQSGYSEVFRYNEADGIGTLDPAYAKNRAIMWPVHQLYNTLVEVDSMLQIVPSLAKSWTFSADRKTIRFYLRTDVRFHDDAAFTGGRGRLMNAEDVKYSLSRILNPATASPGAWIFNNKVDSTQPFAVVNDSVFEIRLLQPFQPILGILSMQYCSIVPREAVEKYGADFRRRPVGTGPFRFVAWEEGQALILHRNDHYFEKDNSGYALPYLKGIKVSFFDSKATEFLEFRQGRLDFINDLDASFKDELLTRKGELQKAWNGKLVMHKYPYLNLEYLGFLADTSQAFMKQSPLQLLKVRKAINYAIDRKKMMMYLRNGIGTAAESGFVPAGLPSFDSNAVKGYRYDPAKASSLLKEAGFDAAHPVPEITLLTVPNYASLGSYIVNELKQAGIPAKVEVVQKSLLLEQTSKSQVPFFRGSWIADYPDAENYLGVFYSKNPAPPNYTRYKNSVYDVLYETAWKETNDSIRYQMYQQMDSIIMADAVVVPLWYDMVLHLVHPKVKGFYPNSLNMLELRHTSKQ